MASEQVRIVLTAQDNASAVINNVTRQTDNLFKNIQQGVGLGIGQMAFTQALNLITRGFGVAQDSVIGFNASLEQSKIAWETMLGSAARSDKMIADLQEFAAVAGSFEFPDLERSARQILAMGFSANQVLPTIKAISTAGASLGLGSEGVSRITLALGQMRATGRVTGEEMRQLTEAGISAWEILSQATGKPVGELRKLSETGKITAQTFIDAFLQTYGPLGKFGDLLEKQARTFNGAMSNMRDAVRLRLGRAFEPVFNGIRDLALSITNLLMSEGLKKWADETRVALMAVGAALSALTSNVNVMKAAVISMLPFIAAWGALWARSAAIATAAWVRATAVFIAANLPLIAVVTGIALAVTALSAVIIANWDEIGPRVGNAISWISEKIAGLLDWMGSTFIPFLGEVARSAWSLFTFPARMALNFIGMIWERFFGQVLSIGKEGFDAILDLARVAWSGFVDFAVTAFGFILDRWNDFIGALDQLAAQGIHIPGLEFLEGKYWRVSQEAMNEFATNLRGLPDVVSEKWQGLSEFIIEALPNGVMRAVAMVQDAWQSIGNINLQDIINQITGSLGLIQDVEQQGEATGAAFGQGMMKAAKPLVEELAKLIAEKLGAPAREALEDTQFRLKEIELELGVKGLLSPEERRAARAERRQITRFVLPGQELEAARAERGISLADRALQRANRENAILENIRAQQEQLTTNLQGVQTAAAQTTQAAITGAPTAVPGAPTAAIPVAAKEPTRVQLTLAVVFEGGQPTTIYDELIEANGQAITPPVIPVSAVRRAT